MKKIYVSPTTEIIRSEIIQMICTSTKNEVRLTDGLPTQQGSTTGVSTTVQDASSFEQFNGHGQGSEKDGNRSKFNIWDAWDDDE